jgi:hypothetical protein
MKSWMQASAWVGGVWMGAMAFGLLAARLFH